MKRLKPLIILQTLYNGGAEYANFRWCPGEYKTKVHLVPRKGGEIKTIECPFDYMAFHYANAFESEDGQTVFVDTPVYDDPQIINDLGLKNLHQGKTISKSTLK